MIILCSIHRRSDLSLWSRTVENAINRVTAESNALGNFTYAYVDDTPGSSKGSSRLASVTYPNSQVTKYSWYPPTGDERLQQIANLKTSSGPTISQFNYRYNPAGEITQWQQLQGNSSVNLNLGYDQAGQLTSSQTGSGGPSNAYLNQNYFAYDPASNRTAVQQNSVNRVKLGGTVTTGDTLTITVKDSSLAGGQEAVNYTVVGGDTLSTTKSLSGGATETITLAPATSASQYSYNNLNELTAIAAGGATRFEATTNKAIKSATVNSNPAALNWSKNFAGNATLSNATNTVPVSATDGANNTVTNNYQVAVTGPSSSNQTHDANGNMTSDGTNSYSWDAENRLIKITYPGVGNLSEFLYDANGLQGQIVETRSSNVTSTKQFVRFGVRIFEERDVSNSIQKKFYLGGQVIGAASYCYNKDHLGTIRSMTDSSGNVIVSYDYDCFGQPVRLSGSIDSDFQYAGYYIHKSSGLNLTLHRAYNAELARWLSRDPIEEAADLNLFSYIRNNPILFIDPTGLQSERPAAGPWDDCNRKCPDGSDPVVVTRAAWGSFYLCRGDSIITRGRDGYEPAIDNGYTIARHESQQATDARHAEDLAKFTGLGKDIQNATAEINRRQEQRRQEEQAAFWQSVRNFFGF